MTSKRSILFATSLVLLSASSQAADLVLVERATVTTGVVRLADVAAILNAGPAEIDRLGRLPLMPAPAPGMTQMVRGQAIRELLAAHDWDLSTLRFRGADQIVISSELLADRVAPLVEEPREAHLYETPRSPQTGFRRYSSSAVSIAAPRRVRMSARQLETLTEELAQQLSQYVQRELGDPLLYAMDVELRDRNAQMLAAADSAPTVRPVGELSAGSQQFLVMFESAEGPVKFPVNARIVEARPAVLVRRDVPRGMMITAADVHVGPLPQEYRVRGAETVLAQVDQVIGKEAARRLRVGEVLTDGNSLPPKMVKRGELVSVAAGNGAVRVRVRAKAMRDGREGEVIEIESLDSRERFDARVVGHGQLAVLSAGATTVHSVADLIDPARTR